jgi:hypothetical protein
LRATRVVVVIAAAVTALSVVTAAGASPPEQTADRFSPESLPAIDSVQSRDLVIDHRGLGYLRKADGGLEPYGHSVVADRRPVSPRARGGVPGPPGPGGGGDVVTFGEWANGGQVDQSAGRILFELSDGWYVCSGTVVTDSTTGRSIVLTAAHCVYDDIAKDFALSAVFIPNQDDGGDRSDFDCGNDPYGCWILDHGVVDVNWTSRTFPDNIQWDYGYYVVSDLSSHSTTDFASVGNGALDGTVGGMLQSFLAPAVGDEAHALGYSYDVDPEFMYCKEPLNTNGSNNYWLGRCNMAGGSSGGPWVQPMNEATGDGPVFSVNSWGYTFQSGMAGPKLHGTSAPTLFDYAKVSDLTTTDRGYVVSPGSAPPTTTITTSTTTTTMEPTTTTTIEPGSLATDSTSQGRTWTAIVNGPDPLSGTFDFPNGACTGGACAVSSIPKSVGSVTFTADGPNGYLGSVIVDKP